MADATITTNTLFKATIKTYNELLLYVTAVTSVSVGCA